jgi:hypothetical protein
LWPMRCAMSAARNRQRTYTHLYHNRHRLCSPLNSSASCVCYSPKPPFPRNSRNPRQITETASGTPDCGQGSGEQPTPDAILFPDVPEEDRNKVIAAFKQGIPRREICSYLRWGNAKYSTIVKPVLDSYEHQAGTQEQETPC